jgi:integrase
MARATHQLTAIKVASLKAPGLYPDGLGLYLRITQGGGKAWIYRFTANGKTRDMGLGPITVVSLAQARQIADECRRQRREGLDPIELRKTKPATEGAARRPTFQECAEQLISSHEPAWRNPKHRQQWKNTLKAYAYPILGDTPVTEIDTTLVLKVLQQPMPKAGRESLWSSRSETASRLRGRLERVLSWAKARGYRTDANPAIWRGHLDRLLPARTKLRRVRHHPALPYVEMPAFISELRDRDGIAARALEFTILTASRTGEALGTQFSEIDLDRKLWTVPASRMKGGKEHRVPLSARTIALIKEMAAIRPNEFVFPGMKQGRPLSDMALLMLLRDMRPGLTVHGFRSTFKDWAAERTYTPNFVSEAALAHVIADKVEGACRRGDVFEKRRKLMDSWAQYCARSPGDVVQLRKGVVR